MNGRDSLNLDPAQAEGLARLRQQIEVVGPWLRERVIPVVSISVESVHPRVVGTGVLLRVAGLTILIIAHHVLDDAHPRGQRERQLAVPNLRQNRLVPVGGQVASNSADGIDVGIVVLDDGSSNDLRDQPGITLDEVDASWPPPTGVFALVGFPRVASRATVDPKGLAAAAIQLWGEPWSGSVDALGGFRVDDHLLMTLDRTTLVRPDGTRGDIARELGGISGCPMWLVYADRKAPTSLSSIQPKMVAVETMVYEPKSNRFAVRGTRVAYALKMILETRPELRDAFDLTRR